MALDPSIPLSIRPIDPVGAYYKGVDQRQDREFRLADLMHRERAFEVQQQAMAKRQEQDGIEAHRENILRGAQIIRQIKPRDEVSWQQARAAAQQLGVPLEGVPDTFDPAYVDRLVAIADTLDPQQQAKPQGLINVAPGGTVFDPISREAVFQSPLAPKYVKDGAGNLIEVQPGAPATGSPDLDKVWQSLIQQESGGRPGVVGPATPYGRAQGLTQMLPATAQAMAGKLNVPWEPRMMTDASPEAAQYQAQLGRAYFEEGLQKYGGDVRKALMYYHGGPDEKLWGPKTRAYAEQVLARAGGSGGSSVRQIGAAAPPKAAGGKGAPSGYRFKEDGSLEPIPGGPADKSGGNTPEMVTQSYERAVSTASRLLQHPGFSSAVGMPNPLGGNLGFGIIPGTPAADFRGELDALKAQVFLPMVQAMKGMGALSNMEGQRLSDAIGALDTRMSEGQFKASLKRIIGDLNRYRGKAFAPSGNGWKIERVK